MLILLSVILMGLHGLLSIIFLMIISRMKIGRDPEGKHGVTSGASRLGGLSILFSLFTGIVLNLHLGDNLSFKNFTEQFSYPLLFSILVGFIGLIEDLKQALTSLLRLFFIILIISLLAPPFP